MPGPLSTQSTLFFGKKSNGQRPNTSSPIQRSKQAIKARLGRLSVDMYSRENTGNIRSVLGNNLATGIKEKARTLPTKQAPYFAKVCILLQELSRLTSNHVRLQ